MFGKKHLEVKMVKDPKSGPSLPERQASLQERQDKNAVIREVSANASIIIDKAVLGGLLLVGAYFASDTIRHCAIHIVATKVQPSVIVETVKSK